MPIKIKKISRGVNVFVKGHGLFSTGQEKELDGLLDDDAKLALAGRGRVEVGGSESKAKSKSKASKANGASAQSDDNP